MLTVWLMLYFNKSWGNVCFYYYSGTLHMTVDWRELTISLTFVPILAFLAEQTP